jgi:hypothetical protein
MRHAARAQGTADCAGCFAQLFEFPGQGPRPQPLSQRLSWRRRRGVPSMSAGYGFLTRLLSGHRFDWIAAGLRRFTENLLAAWATSAVRETGIRRIACAGGVFMNVKANLPPWNYPRWSRCTYSPPATTSRTVSARPAGSPPVWVSRSSHWGRFTLASQSQTRQRMKLSAKLAGTKPAVTEACASAGSLISRH